LLSTLPHGNAVTLVVQAGNVRPEGTFTLLIKRLHRRTSPAFQGRDNSEILRVGQVIFSSQRRTRRANAQPLALSSILKSQISNNQ
jgi:hypothetical protein